MENPSHHGYRLGDTVGRGSTGPVVAATDEHGNEFAIKVLRPELAADHDLVTRLMRECAVLARVRKPNLVGVHDCLVDGDFVGIVRDRVTGTSLREHLRDAGTLLPAEVARIGAGIAAALAALHNVGVLHLDLRPENILLDQEKTPRVTGFGLFALIAASAGGRAVPITRRAQYSAPELITEQPANSGSDLYALGIVLYELCCGVVPFGGTDYTVMRHQVRSAPPRPPGVPDLLWAVVDGLLAKDPAARIGPAANVAELLEGMVGELVNAPCASKLTSPPESTPIEPTPPPQSGPRPTPSSDSGTYLGYMPVGGAVPKPRRRRLVLLSAAALLVAIGVFAGWALSGSGSGNAQSSPAAPQNTTATALPPVNQTDTPTTTTVPPMTTAPNLVGEPLAKAQDSLPNSIKVTYVDTIDASQSDNTVVAQDPTAGQPLNGTMQLTVARQPVTVYLDSLPILSGDNGAWENANTGLVAGKTYTDSLVGDLAQCDSNPRYVEYDIGKDYRQFVASVGIGDQASDSSIPASLTIFTDGRQVSTTAISYGQMYPIKVDLSGVLRLKIEWQEVLPNGRCSGDSNQLVLGGAALLGLPGEVPSDTPTPTN
ncbi:MAG TPA: protein kinase [Pseudonocardiaceae bacterium]|jgi:serine/threonine-protein kinase